MDGNGEHPRYAAAERAALADTLTEIGPDAPTLCEGWASRHLAAHLVVRERRPLASLGNVVPFLAGRTERVQRRLAETRVAAGEYPRLVEEVRRGPRWGPLRIARVDEAVNLVEFFVHHEDLRRTGTGWTVRDLPPGYTAALWGRVGTLARLNPTKEAGTVVLVAPGFGRVRRGREGREVTVTGAPPELLLWLFGRRSVAEVMVDRAS
jgi:uncharacterized protein (TIGR03085 family)